MKVSTLVFYKLKFTLKTFALITLFMFAIYTVLSILRTERHQTIPISSVLALMFHNPLVVIIFLTIFSLITLAIANWSNKKINVSHQNLSSSSSFLSLK